MMAAIEPAEFVTFAELRAAGTGRAALERMLRAGVLVRVRRGRYASGALCDELLAAARLGGRLDCVSLLRLLGVFVHGADGLHLQFDRVASRLPQRGDGVRAHWRVSGSAFGDLCVDITEALAQACRCVGPRLAVAMLDSAWHLGVVDESGIAEVFARLPVQYRAVRRLLDPRSESGPETIVRLMLRQLGCRVEVQARIPGVGRVDLLVDGWLIVECDSRAFHSDWQQHREDRRRDAAAATLGYVTIRPIAEDILFHPEIVRAALAGLLRGRSPRSRRQAIAASR